ncbi:MAG: NIPSNAP family protein [Leptolyngbya sp. BL-A-14]
MVVRVRGIKDMIYELRIYHAVPGRLPALLSRFQNHTIQIWEKHGIRQAGFWTTLVGESNQQLTYMLAWDSMAEREERWNSFITDPEWIAVSKESEKDGPLVQSIRNELLVPTAFSSVQ